MSTTNNTSKYVVLEHLTLPDKGLRFWTSNTENNTHGYNGELWYKEVAFTDDTDEAIRISCKGVPTSTHEELVEYWDKYWQKIFDAYDTPEVETVN